MRPWFASIVLLWVLALSVAPASAATLRDVVRETDSNFLFEARRDLETLDENVLATPEGRYVTARLEFFEGDYEEALAGLREAIEGAREEVSWKHLRDQVELSRSASAGMSVIEGASGRFSYRYVKGEDALLVPYADKALAAQLAALEGLFGDKVKERVQVILVPDTETLSRASGLTVEQIERTSTVGICKYGKVMVLSPRVLATGYPWLDTLAHELTHYFITRASRNNAPIWLQEGVAKTYELQWRKTGLTDLTPEEAYLLDRAAREGRLIPLRRFHPSVAHLPSQEDSSLAYAQVLSFMRYVDHRLGGGDWIVKILRRLGDGANVDEAFEEASRFNVRRLYLWWEQTAKGTRQTPVPVVGLMKRRFKSGDVAGGAGQQDMETETRRHVRIGDLLRRQGHEEAAVRKYREALKLADAASPSIAERLGGCLLNLGRHQEVVDLLAPMVELYPAHPTGFVQLGRAYKALGRQDEAADMLERAVALNPFHPEVHCMLAELHEARGQDEAASVEESVCRMLGTGKR